MSNKLDFYFTQSSYIQTLTIKNMTLKKALKIVSSDKRGLTRLHVKNEDFLILQKELNINFHIWILHINVYFKGYTTITEVDIPLDIHN